MAIIHCSRYYISSLQHFKHSLSAPTEMSYDELSDYLAFRNNIKRLLRLVGLWSTENPSIFYRFLPVFFMFAILCELFGISGYLKLHTGDVSHVTNGISMLVGLLAVLLKMVCVVLNRDEMNEVHIILDLHFSKLLKDQKISTTILMGLSTFRRLSWAFTFFVGLSIFTYLVAPIIFIVHQHLNHVDPVIYPLIYPTAYPWSINPPGFRYKIHFLIDVAALVPHFCVTPGIDSLFMLYGFQMMAQFREMSLRIMCIDKITDDRNVVNKCVRQHQSMMRCRDILQRIYGPILLCVTTTNAISLCSIIFQLTQVKNMTIITKITFAAYAAIKVTQAFSYAYTGTCLTSESEVYQNAVYSANWHTNKRFMTSILIMLSQKPIILTACNFSVISLDIFVKVLNTTMSYFFLLRTIS